MNNNIEDIKEELELELSLIQEETEDIIFDDEIYDQFEDDFEYDEEFDKEEADINGEFWNKLRESRKNIVVQNITQQQSATI